MAFLNDLSVGREFEKDVMDWFNSTLLMEVEWNKDKKGIDLLHWDLSIEVKYDRLMRTTWNLFLEFECNKVPSWVFKDEGAVLLAYWDYLWVLIFDILRLREEFPSLIDRFKVVNWGDWYRSRWLLLPIEEARKLAKWEIYLTKL